MPSLHETVTWKVDNKFKSLCGLFKLTWMHGDATWCFHVSLSSFYYEETLLNDIQRAREKYQDKELAKELAWIKLRIDNTEVLSSDIIINLLQSYRDIQVWNTLIWG